MVKGDNKPSTNKHSVQIAQIIKIYSAFILIVDIIFICFIGEKEKPNQTQSIDQQLKRAMPLIYSNLDFIGFRMYADPGTSPDDIIELQKQVLKFKFISYIAYLMISIYIE